MKAELSEDEESDMLDFLYTSQYHMNVILAISLGRIAEPGTNGYYTYAVYMRFQKKEDFVKFYNNSYYLGVVKYHVSPHCYGSISVDYESQVQDDILAIFR
ncbi:hypothetical protein ZOSMA_119G00010 [Zostera marina]|uniref:Stress-response A/B barrel domain-containing protein n=1 Tax=Zostera marina TaxID=29655 RepID=A0A0K9Q1G5_ZOSMR|nr:hypothetical protein ZOSMA_119G00010 [Zostera marina]